MFSQLGLTVERVSAIDGRELDISSYTARGFHNPGAIALVQTNIAILRDALSNGFEQVLILEDDVEFGTEVLNLDVYFDALPEDWDMLYFGAAHNTEPEVINGRIIQLKHSYTAHCVGIRSRLFETILNAVDARCAPIDVVYAELQSTYKVYSFYPAIASQRPCYSDIEGVSVDYRWLIK